MHQNIEPGASLHNCCACVSNSNVEIRIAGSSDRPQKCHELSHGKMHVSSRPMECEMTSLMVDWSTVCGTPTDVRDRNHVSK